MNETEIALNISRCLQSKSFLGYTEFYNICTGKWMYTIAWTGMDWFGFWALVGFGTVIVVALLGLLITVALD